MIAADLSKHKELENRNKRQQINLSGNLERDSGAAIVFATETSEEIMLNF